jgi:DNA-binding GntR family transcriptional regulator
MDVKLNHNSDLRELQNLKAIEVISRVDAVYKILRSAIISGTYRPGEQLRAAELAKEVGGSVSPVREALRRLQSDGLVEFIPNKGARVSEVSSNDLKDIYSTRRLLEGQALTLAHPNLNQESLDAGLALVKQMTTAFEGGDMHEMERLHRAVHFTMYEPSNSPWLLKLIGIIWDNCGRYLSVSPWLRESPKAFGAEHERMLRVAANESAEAAVAELNKHLTHTESLMMANYQPAKQTILSLNSLRGQA